MKRRNFINALGSASGVLLASPLMAGSNDSSFQPIEEKVEQSGIWNFTIGTPEKITPAAIRSASPKYDQIEKLPKVETCPVKVEGSTGDRGVLVRIPLTKEDSIYGLGLQFQSFQQRGFKKMLRVNADPEIDTGDSHAPVPFFVTTSGYGVLVDTARYATFYLGNKKKRPKRSTPKSRAESGDVKDALDGVYAADNSEYNSEVLIDIPRASGVRVYVFAGPSMKQAVQRYNLFSGGGALPPRWGLGFWYRAQSDFNQEEVLGMADYFRNSKIPCDVLGLEPHWQTHAYSCSYVWSDLFPQPKKMIETLRDKHFKVNLWEHAFVHPSSPIYDDLLPHSGDYEVWGGLVPDFSLEKSRKVFADFHEKEHVDLGISGYKADECDNSDFTGNWSFPEISQFPSGADGEQMHSLFGLLYQKTINGIFEKKDQRTYGLVRSSGALASSYPFVIYSDLYDHKTFIHGVAQSGFSGLLWTPEVRHATSNEDLIRRLQTVVFSPLAMVNAWYLKNAPWKQINREANNNDQFAENWQELEAQCRKIIELRMKLVPYLHAAFVDYYQTGTPPCRALVMDYPDDVSVKDISSQFLVGENLLVAPVVASENSREVYLPKGDWFDFWTHQKYAGGKKYQIDVPTDQIPVFVKSGTMLPLAKPTLHTADPESRKLQVLVFGSDVRPFVLYEDDDTAKPEITAVSLVWNEQIQKGKLERKAKANLLAYSVDSWKVIW